MPTNIYPYLCLKETIAESYWHLRFDEDLLVTLTSTVSVGYPNYDLRSNIFDSVSSVGETPVFQLDRTRVRPNYGKQGGIDYYNGYLAVLTMTGYWTGGNITFAVRFYKPRDSGYLIYREINDVGYKSGFIPASLSILDDYNFICVCRNNNYMVQFTESAIDLSVSASQYIALNSVSTACDAVVYNGKVYVLYDNGLLEEYEYTPTFSLTGNTWDMSIAELDADVDSWSFDIVDGNFVQYLSDHNNDYFLTYHSGITTWEGCEPCTPETTIAPSTEAAPTIPCCTFTPRTFSPTTLPPTTRPPGGFPLFRTCCDYKGQMIIGNLIVS